MPSNTNESYKLDISDNSNFTSESLEKLTNLNVLYIEENYLLSLTQAIAKFPLEKLKISISSTLLLNLKVFTNLTSLKIVADFEETPLDRDQIQDCVPCLINLCSLSLIDCFMNDCSDLKKLTNLLSLTGNKLVRFEDLNVFTSLTFLSIDSENITAYAFRNLTNLTTLIYPILYLSKSKIYEILLV